MANKTLAYTNEYKNKCFTVWYADKTRSTSPSKVRKLIPEDDLGRKPNYPMIAKWMAELEWNERADEMDAKAMILVEETLVHQKAEMLKRQALDAFAIANKAKEYILGEDGFDTSASAVNAYFRATEEERVTRGVGEFISKVYKMTAEEIKKRIIEYTNRAADSGQIVLDAEEIENKKEDNLEEDDMTD